MDAEKLGSFVKDQAQDMVHHGSGFLVQSDWRRGVQRLRDGIHRARELGVVLTHRRTIFKYFMELETARSEVARQLTSDGFHKPPSDPDADCSVRILDMLAQFAIIMNSKSGSAAIRLLWYRY
jgi:acetaldehyde dehydrogenase (acetylating)